MRLPLLVTLISLVCMPLAHGQGTPAPAAAAAKEVALDKDWRSTEGYTFPALAKTVADMQNLAHAMHLRDYCSDLRVSDEFVRERLARFSQLTGRQETCRSLLDY
ncbi:hypothetical protein CEW87_00890 [Parazoarcus communis]|uniref:UrcA family protein n=1 Tax=Parazoarcus communis TaxID=41977 RepID=A0A2U8GX58_9RHOO|nr:hypothetical protein [Parazoarcus communis]AWI78024.1 hypothetical protein CEW87_00890 [Parazoarcus communis]